MLPTKISTIYKSIKRELKHISLSLASQEKPHKSFQLSDLRPDQEVTTNIDGWLSQQDRSVVLVLSFFMNNKHKIPYMSQEFIATRLELCRASVNRAIKLLNQHCILAKCYRYHTSSLYRLSSFFKDPSIKKKVGRRLRQLISVVSFGLMGQVTLLLSKEVNYMTAAGCARLPWYVVVVSKKHGMCNIKPCRECRWSNNPPWVAVHEQAMSDQLLKREDETTSLRSDGGGTSPDRMLTDLAPPLDFPLF